MGHHMLTLLLIGKRGTFLDAKNMPGQARIVSFAIAVDGQQLPDAVDLPRRRQADDMPDAQI